LQAAKINKVSGSSAEKVALLQRQALAFSIPSPGPNVTAVSTVGKVSPTVSSYDALMDGSPGVTVGWTWQDYQHNGSIGRMIETGPHSGHSGEAIVHMGWMYLADSILGQDRYYTYNAYKSADNSFSGQYLVSTLDEKGGYVNVDVTPDNRALVGGHCAAKGKVEYQTQIYFDSGPADEIFDFYVRIPDSVAGYQQIEGEEACWPKFFFQFGIDTVLHVIAQINNPTATHNSLAYYRRVGAEQSVSTDWDFPPYIVDTVCAMAHDVTGIRQGNRVAISWTASLPYQQPWCDTCSGFSLYGDTWVGQMDNDLYYQISNDQGATWEPRVNVTGCALGEACDKAFADLSMLFDESDNLHLIWAACPWPADPCIVEYGSSCFQDDFYVQAGRLLHWSENYPYIRVICDHTQGFVDSCGPPNWALRVAKPTISACDNKLYAIWTQFNSIEEGIVDDCAEWSIVLDEYWGGANGDLWVSASSDGGMTWSNQYNLTNSYTPNCDPVGGEPCQHDYWASMSRYGRATQPGEDWTFIPVVDPMGSSFTDYYLDIQYMNDLCAGTGGSLGSVWTNNPMKWFRMPCFEPEPCGPFCPIVEPAAIGYPTYAKPGWPTYVPLTIENDNCYPIDYTYSIEEDNGPTGWLAVLDLSGTVAAGPNEVETGTIVLNNGGIIVDEGLYYGRINLEFSYLGAPFMGGACDGSVEVELLVEDTVVPPVWDTVNTACLALTVSTNGNMGRSGRERVNMDFYPEDCDSTAKIYMYDGSPYVGRILDGDTVFSCAVWGVDYTGDGGFRPVCCENIPAEYCSNLDAEVFESGAFVTKDSAIGFERIWVAPQDDCGFIIQHTRVWAYDGVAHDDLLLGEVIDWDVPWDYLADDENQERPVVNFGFTDGVRGMIFQQGYEAYGAGSDTGYPYNCQYNNERFAGNAFVESYLNGAYRFGGPYSGFVGELDRLVFPAVEGFVPGLFYQEAMVSGLRGSDSLEDLFSALAYEPQLDLGATDVYEVVTVLATIQQGTLADLQAAVDAGKAWYAANDGIDMFADDDEDGQIDACQSCCQLMGDFDKDGELTPMDAVIMVQCMWGFWPPSICDECREEGDVNCSGSMDPLDAVYLINYFWRGGSAPCTCAQLP